MANEHNIWATPDYYDEMLAKCKTLEFFSAIFYTLEALNILNFTPADGKCVISAIFMGAAGNTGLSKAFLIMIKLKIQIFSV